MACSPGHPLVGGGAPPPDIEKRTGKKATRCLLSRFSLQTRFHEMARGRRGAGGRSATRRAGAGASSGCARAPTPRRRRAGGPAGDSDTSRPRSRSSSATSSPALVSVKLRIQKGCQNLNVRNRAKREKARKLQRLRFPDVEQQVHLTPVTMIFKLSSVRCFVL